MLKAIWKRGAVVLVLQLIIGIVTYVITDDLVPTGAAISLAAFFAVAMSAAFGGVAIFSAMVAQPAVFAVSVVCVMLVTLIDTGDRRREDDSEKFFVLFLTALPAGIGFTIGGTILLFRHLQQQKNAVV